MHRRVDVVSWGDDPNENPMAQSIAMLVWTAWKGGVRKSDESMTIMVPEMDIGEDEKSMVDVGEFEITIRKV